jgi:hypothetical protein
MSSKKPFISNPLQENNFLNECYIHNFVYISCRLNTVTASIALSDNGEHLLARKFKNSIIYDDESDIAVYKLKMDGHVYTLIMNLPSSLTKSSPYNTIVCDSNNTSFGEDAIITSRLVNGKFQKTGLHVEDINRILSHIYYSVTIDDIYSKRIALHIKSFSHLVKVDYKFPIM